MMNSRMLKRVRQCGPLDSYTPPISVVKNGGFGRGEVKKKGWSVQWFKGGVVSSLIRRPKRWGLGRDCCCCP